MRRKPRTRVDVAHEEVFVTLRVPLERRRAQTADETVVVMIGLLLVDGQAVRVSAAAAQTRGAVKDAPPRAGALARKKSAAKRRAK